MADFPQARVEGFVVVDVPGALIVQSLDGHEKARLDRITGLVWRLADGQTSVDKIVDALSAEIGVTADNETVWAALDRLADSDLISERVTPPGASIADSRGGNVVMTVEDGPIRESIANAAGTIPGEMEEQIQKGAERLEKEVKGKEDQVKEAANKESQAKEKLGKEAEELMKKRN